MNNQSFSTYALANVGRSCICTKDRKLNNTVIPEKGHRFTLVGFVCSTFSQEVILADEANNLEDPDNIEIIKYSDFKSRFQLLEVSEAA